MSATTQVEDITLRVGVKVMLRNKYGKYLLLKRSLKAYPEVVGRWDIPGGRIVPGTTLVENLAREIREETNLQLASVPVFLFAQDILRIKGIHTVRLIFRADCCGDFKLGLEDHEDYCWLTIPELKRCADLDIYLLDFLNRYQKRK
jgi:8-oxo-dGTP diphosphatase